MKRRRALLVTLALSAALVAAVVGLRRPYAWFLARHWRNRLKTVPEERVDVLLEGIARLGDPGIPVLVEALGSERACVAAGARRVLAKEMGRWELLRARDYSPKLAILAEALADHVDQFPLAARAEAADLAARILGLWTLDDAVVDPAQVIASCEKVLRTPSPQRPVLAQRPSWEPLADTSAEQRRLASEPNPLRAGLPQAGEPRPQRDLSLAESTPSPRAPLGSETAEAPGLASNAIRSPEPGETQLAEPRRLDRDEPSRSVQHPLRPLAPSGSGGPTPQRGSGRSGEAELTDVPRVRPLRFLSDATGGSVDLPGRRFDPVDPARLDTVELMRRLQAADQDAVEAAREELARRGFTEVHLALARQLFHPDPEVRARLGRVLLALPNIDAAPWLIELSRDEDPEVRLAAISLMGTTGDEALLRAVENSARQDPDPRVQQQAERIARKRRAARY